MEENKYIYVLETPSKKEIVDMVVNEPNYQSIEGEKGYYAEVIRSKETGSYNVYVSTDNSEFTKSEIMVLNSYIQNIGRKLDFIGSQKIGVKLDKVQDVRPFVQKDFNTTGYGKTYKTIKYARMIAITWLELIKELHSANPDNYAEYLKYEIMEE